MTSPRFVIFVQIVESALQDTGYQKSDIGRLLFGAAQLDCLDHCVCPQPGSKTPCLGKCARTDWFPLLCMRFLAGRKRQKKYCLQSKLGNTLCALLASYGHPQLALL
ncbi:Hypothetical_protein [Hexamita inflata]|uniref:Hypothetical_protein n=1 Tax=Hexamita inflata TaxID=28002 RepID=A0AA86R0U4_9EUKA|nr:Hypothetical protein HINF_LOCUS48220 [Hexamita inflata]